MLRKTVQRKTIKNSELRIYSVSSASVNQRIHTTAHTHTLMNPHEGHLRDKHQPETTARTAHTHHYTHGQDTQHTREDTISYHR